MLPFERANEDLQYGTGYAYAASGQWAAEPRHTQSQSGTETVAQSRARREGLGLQSAAGGWDCVGTGI